MEKPENQEVKSKKDLFLSKMKEKYPDMDTEDEEGLYGKINDDYDDYDGKLSAVKKNEEDLSKLFSSDPRSAAFLMAWKAGENPIYQMIKLFGDDFKEMLNDPEIQDKVSEARSEYLEKQANNQKLQDEASKNLDETLSNLDKVQQEGGYSDEEADKVYDILAQILDDGIVNKVSVDTWSMIFKAVNYEKDIQVAAHEAEVKAKNTKIEEKLKKTIPDMPPMMGGQGSANREEKKSLGALDRFESPRDIFAVGGEKRKRK